MPDADIETFKGQLPLKARIPRNGFRFYAHFDANILARLRRREKEPARFYTGNLCPFLIASSIGNRTLRKVQFESLAVKFLPTARRFLNHMSARLKSIGRVNVL